MRQVIYYATDLRCWVDAIQNNVWAAAVQDGTDDWKVWFRNNTSPAQYFPDERAAIAYMVNVIFARNA